MDQKSFEELVLSRLDAFVPPSNHFGIGPLPGWWAASGRAVPEEHLHVDRVTGLPLQITRRADGTRMVLVPAGTYALGEGATAREVELGSFYIDAHPQTIYAFQDFLEEQGEARYDGHGEAWADGDMAAYGVRWDHAQLRAEALGVAIPGEDEWEAAARGADGRSYPWGEEPPAPERAVFWCDEESFEQAAARHGSTAANFVRGILQRKAGRSPFGAHDMAGNVAEWCRPGPAPPPGASEAVLRGGSWRSADPAELRCTARAAPGEDPRCAGTSGVRFVLRLPAGG